jgi:tRNA-modifying protein YgfZ
MTTNSNIMNNSTNTNIICNLSNLGLLEVSGADALTFLQGQVTNDVKQLTVASQVHLTAYCNPKGRMLALFLAFYQNERFHLQFNHALIEPIMKRLKMYVMRSKVEIKDISNSLAIIGIDGPEATSILTSSLAKISCDIELPINNHELVTFSNTFILKLPSIAGHTRYEIITDTTNASEIEKTLKQNCLVVEQTYWDWLDIKSGIPDVLKATQEQFVPQMLNLDLLNGINFKKGCYTGQEIVARTHYLGSVKRRTYLVEIYSAESPKAGDKIFDVNQNEIGQVVRVASNAYNQFDALVELRIESAIAGNVFWNHIAIKFNDLPYSLES